jgi:hypothetical protein
MEDGPVSEPFLETGMGGPAVVGLELIRDWLSSRIYQDEQAMCEETSLDRAILAIRKPRDFRDYPPLGGSASKLLPH